MPRPAREAAVLQAAMSTAMVSVKIAGRYGCDAALAAAAAVVTTLATRVSLPLVLAAAHRFCA